MDITDVTITTNIKVLDFRGNRIPRILNTQTEDIFVLSADMLEDGQKQDSNGSFIVIWVYLYKALGFGVEY